MGYEGELDLKSNVHKVHPFQEVENVVMLLELSSCKCPLVFIYFLLPFLTPFSNYTIS
jgi:hypothetical protein